MNYCIGHLSANIYNDILRQYLNDHKPASTVNVRLH